MSGIMNMFVATKTTIATAVDAFFNSVSLLLNTSSTNGAQNNTFLDSSTNNFTITRNGNTTQGTFTPFSQTGWSNYFGSSNFLTTPSSSAFNLSSGDWTIEGWFWLNTNTDDTRLFTIVNSSTDMYGAFVRSGTVRFGQIGVGDAAFGTVNLNTWNHIAFSKTSTSTVTCYINGVSTGSTTSYTLPNANCTAYIVASPANYALATTNGYVSNFRIVKGTAVYTSAFTPSTTPLTAITNTSLLTCQSNRFVDNSTNTFALTVNGTPSVQAFSPFLPTAAHDTAVVGGSGYFDGTGDYLTVGSGTDVDLGTSDFMIEAWYYCLANGTYASGVISKRVGGAASGWGMTTSGFVCDMAGTWYDSWANPFWVGSTQNSGFNSGTSLQKLNQWTHIVVTRQGTDARWFVNGQLLGYFSRTGAIQQLTGSPLAVGLNGTTAEQPFIGFLSNCRVVVGSVPTGYQTSSTTLNAQIFTPPTTPVTTTSQGATSGNVKYIGNFINAGIYDSAAKNVLETVGNAQVSTTQAKWGTTSMYFDGSSSYLKPPSSVNLSVGSGNFTYEFWLYAGTNSDNCLFDTRTVNNTTSGFAFLIRSSVNLFVYTTANDLTCNNAITANTWQHVALVRNGSTLTAYVNGTSVGSTTFSNNLTDQTISIASYVGGGGYLNGYMDDFRLTKGYARYTANFTPPTAALPLQ